MSTQQGNPKAPSSSLIARRGPLLFASLAVGTAAYFFFAKRPPMAEGTPNPGPSTPGIRNIEGAYSNAGATSTHTKAYGGTPMGDRGNESLKENGPAGTGQPKGFKSGAIGDEQRPSDSTKIEKKFQKSNYGAETGK